MHTCIYIFFFVLITTSAHTFSSEPPLSSTPWVCTFILLDCSHFKGKRHAQNFFLYCFLLSKWRSGELGWQGKRVQKCTSAAIHTQEKYKRMERGKKFIFLRLSLSSFPLFSGSVFLLLQTECSFLALCNANKNGIFMSSSELCANRKKEFSKLSSSQFLGVIIPFFPSFTSTFLIWFSLNHYCTWIESPLCHVPISILRTHE